MTLKTTRFTELLLEANGLDPDDFESWAFCPGMLFDSPDKWWGDYGRRDFPHEGIDLCLARDPSGRISRMDANTRVPVMGDGVVRALFRDYLGRAVIVEHEDAESGQFLTVYAHTRPRDGLQPGIFVEEGDVIATIAETGRSKARILPHLHLTLGRPSPRLAYDNFVWNTIRDPGLVTLMDPAQVMDRPCLVLDSRNPFCLTESDAG